MGAPTENRKRQSPDHPLPFNALPIPALRSDDASPVPPFKKLKLPNNPFSPMLDTSPPFGRQSETLVPPPTIATTTLHPLLVPPIAPLRHPVHGPQRIIKAFGRGSSNSSRPGSSEQAPLRGGQEFRGSSRDIQYKGPNCTTPWKLGSSKRIQRTFDYGDSEVDGRDGGIGLEEYRKLVHSMGTGPRPTDIRPRDVDFSGAGKVLDLVGEDDKGGEDVEMVSPPDEKDAEFLSKQPLYIDLLEKANRYDSSIERVDFSVKLEELRLSAIRSSYPVKEEKPEDEKDINEAFLPLTDEEEKEVNRALYGRKRNEILVTHEASNIEITRELMQCLSSSNWLNDEVINVYLELLKERETREPKKFLKCHFFNTFFFKKLTSGEGGYDFKSVKRWTTQRKLGYGLIECDKIFVPIHKDIHWCLAIIDVKEKKFLYLDSLGGKDTKVLKVLARYFMDEVKDKSNKQIDTLSWKLEGVVGLPLQKNGWDCGMFMLKYIDFYSRGSSLCFGQDSMPYFRMRTVKEILRLRAE